MKQRFILMLLILILAGCAAPGNITPETAAKTSPQPTVTPTLVPTWTPTPTATMTATPTVASTVALAAEPTPTEMAAETPEPASTPTATATATPTATPTMTPTPAPQVRAAGKNVNVRRGPGTVFPVMAVLRDGETAPIIARGPKGWLQIDLNGKAGWIYSKVVEVSGPVDALAVAENIPTPPPTPTPVPPTPTPEQVADAPGQTVNPVGPLPPKQDVVHLTQDTRFPVRANKFIGWGYEIVDASERWDIVMYRDVFGYVLHEFYGDALYKQHPEGMRVTFIDCEPAVLNGLGRVPCFAEEAPFPLFRDKKRLGMYFSDGIGSDIGVGCATPGTNYYNPQECFVSLGPVDVGFLTDIAVTAMILGDKDRLNYTAYETPDMSQPPFTPHLGVAHKDEATQQWRWDNPFIRIVPQQP